MPYVCDGLNEKGLAVGNFIFAGTAGYQKIEADDVGRTIASHEVAVYLLGTCANVQEAVIALQAVRVCRATSNHIVSSARSTTPFTTPKGIAWWWNMWTDR